MKITHNRTLARMSPPPKNRSTEASQSGKSPTETYQPTQAGIVSKQTKPSEDTGLFESLAKTAMFVGLAASLGMGMTGCTTIQTSCTPTHCVTTEQFDPVGTAAVVGGVAAGAIILDAVTPDVYIHGGHGGYFEGYQQGQHQGYHNGYSDGYQGGYQNGTWGSYGPGWGW
jgi:hypothetical protein